MSEVFTVETARLLHVGRIMANPDWAYASHAHPHWEFIYFMQGCGRIDLPHATLHPQQYHLVVYPPGLPHAECTDPTDPEQTIFFSAEVDGAPPAGAHLLLPDQHGDLRWLCAHLFDEFTLRGATSLAGTFLRAFLHLVERAWDCGVPVPHDNLDQVVQYLHANYHAPLTLGALAAVARTSPPHLSHRFAARLGESPMRDLQHLRLEAARRLLLTTDLPIHEIARQVGYDDPLYFTRVFHRATGAAPTIYRRQAKT